MVETEELGPDTIPKWGGVVCTWFSALRSATTNAILHVYPPQIASKLCSMLFIHVVWEMVQRPRCFSAVCFQYLALSLWCDAINQVVNVHTARSSQQRILYLVYVVRRHCLDEKLAYQLPNSRDPLCR